MLMLFPSERPVFLREVQKGMYGVSSYFLSKIITDLPQVIFLPLFQSLIIYWIVGFNTTSWYNFVIYYVVVILTNATMGGYGLILSISISNP